MFAGVLVTNILCIASLINNRQRVAAMQRAWRDEEKRCLTLGTETCNSYTVFQLTPIHSIPLIQSPAFKGM